MSHHGVAGLGNGRGSRTAAIHLAIPKMIRPSAKMPPRSAPTRWSWRPPIQVNLRPTIPMQTTRTTGPAQKIPGRISSYDPLEFRTHHGIHAGVLDVRYRGKALG